MDFILWPRNDIEKIVCLLFSRWKGADDEPFRPVQVSDRHFTSLFCRRALNTHTGLENCLLTQQAKFEFHHGDYEKQCLHALGRKDKAGMVMNNPNQSVFLFMDRQHLQVSLFADAVVRTELINSRHRQLETLHHNMYCASCRLLKPRPQFSSCAAFAFTCPRTS